MAGSLLDITSWIAGLAMPGVSIRNLDEIPMSVAASECPLLVPDPSESFMTDLQFTRETFRGVQSGLRTYTLKYRLHYVLFYRPIGASTRVYDYYAELADVAMQVLTAFAQNEYPARSIDVRPAAMPDLAVVMDGTGTGFHGAKFALDVLEIVN